MYIYIASIRTKLDSSLEGSKALKKLILATFLANFPRRSIFPRENLGLRGSTHWEEVMSHISSHSGGTFLANSHWIGKRRSWKKEVKITTTTTMSTTTARMFTTLTKHKDEDDMKCWRWDNVFWACRSRQTPITNQSWSHGRNSPIMLKIPRYTKHRERQSDNTINMF